MLLSLPACVKFEPQGCRNLRVSLFSVESYAQGDARFRTISTVSSMPQHGVPNSKSRFCSKFLLLLHFQGKSTGKLGLYCDRNKISAATQKISTLKSSGKRKFTAGHFVTAYVCCPGFRDRHKVHAKVLNSTTRPSPSHLAVGVHYQKVAVRTILVQSCTYAKVDLRL